MNNSDILICDCCSAEHQIIIRTFNEDEGEEYKLVYVNIHLVARSFWGRLISGVKYIFGYKCKFGHFEEFILSPSHTPQLKELIKTLES